MLNSKWFHLYQTQEWNLLFSCNDASYQDISLALWILSRPWPFPFVFRVDAAFSEWILTAAFRGLAEFCRDKIWKSEKLKVLPEEKQLGDKNNRLFL